jgi:hypothetical protein
MRRRREAVGMRAVVASAMPHGEAMIVPTLERRPDETDEALMRRRAARAVKIVNVGEDRPARDEGGCAGPASAPG